MRRKMAVCCKRRHTHYVNFRVNRTKPKKKRWGIFVFENHVVDAAKIMARFDDVHTNIGAGG